MVLLTFIYVDFMIVLHIDLRIVSVMIYALHILVVPMRTLLISFLSERTKENHGFCCWRITNPNKQERTGLITGWHSGFSITFLEQFARQKFGFKGTPSH